jgi:hypothetical protein
MDILTTRVVQLLMRTRLVPLDQRVIEMLSVYSTSRSSPLYSTSSHVGNIGVGKCLREWIVSPWQKDRPNSVVGDKRINLLDKCKCTRGYRREDTSVYHISDLLLG